MSSLISRTDTRNTPTRSATAVKLGSERLLNSGRLRGKRIGIVANPASVDHTFTHIVDRLRSDETITLNAIFGPQHGFHATLQDNMIETPHARDDRRQVPVYSLYSETREPTAEMLKDLDVLVIDLQDVGTRVYTFIYTMANCLKAAGRIGLPVIVCDRPNPIGGMEVEGPQLRKGFESFVGLFPIPLRHGLTIAELARFFNDRFALGATLDVIPMEGWSRAMFWDDADVPWIIPSPNMPTLDTAIVYPGQVLFEGTQLSEARGTTRPFELVGAPWIDADRFAASMNAHALPGVHFRATYFEPTFQKFAKQTCGGCQIHVTNRETFRPVLATATLLREFRAANPERFAWRQPPYEYEHDKMPIDILAGSSDLRQQIDANLDPRAIAESWDTDRAAFLRDREPFLLYR
jgi:uncharacterized protein YbbC (DUF1343 family)